MSSPFQTVRLTNEDPRSTLRPDLERQDPSKRPARKVKRALFRLLLLFGILTFVGAGIVFTNHVWSFRRFDKLDEEETLVFWVTDYVMWIMAFFFTCTLYFLSFRVCMQRIRDTRSA